MSEEVILLQAAYEVPLIWFDHAHGRERFAAAVATGSFRLRKVESVDLRGMEGSHRDDVRFEDRTWRPLMMAGGQFCDLDRFRTIMAGSEGGASSTLALSLPVKLTTRGGMPADADGGGLPARIEDSVVERLDAEALGRARLAMERDVIWDGRAIRLLASHHMGVPEGIRHLPNQVRDCVGGAAINLLEGTADLAARDPEVGRLAHAVRRIALRGLLHAIPAGEIESAVHHVDRLAQIAADRAPSRAGRSVGKRMLEMTRVRVIPGLESPPDQVDLDDLALLAP